MNQPIYHVEHWLPGQLIRDENQNITDREPPTPCPNILTMDEAIRYLRFDEVGNPRNAIDRVRNSGQLQGYMQGKGVKFRRVDLDKYVTERMESNPA